MASEVESAVRPDDTPGPGAPTRALPGAAVEPGQPGDLCMLSEPPGVVLAELDAEMVAATIVGGEVV
jgi:hypothetical protein